MKKTLFIIAAAIAFASCAKDIQPVTSAETADGTITFIGSAIGTKATVGEKDGTAYPALWAAGDALDIYDSTCETKLGTATLADGAGSNTGTFTFTPDSPIADGTGVVLVFPAGAEQSVAFNQTQASAGVCDLNGITYAYAAATIEEGQAAFALTHAPALVKFELSSTAYADWNVTEVMFDCSRMPLSGPYTVDKATNISTSDGISFGSTTWSGIDIKLNTPAKLSDSPAIWGAVIPTDLSGKDVYATVKLSKGELKTVIAKKLSGKAIQAGKANVISWTDIDHVYTDLSSPVYFPCYSSTVGEGDALVPYLENLSPLFSTNGQGGAGVSTGTGHGIAFGNDYGTASTAYMCQENGTSHNNDFTQDAFVWGEADKGQFAIMPFFKDDAVTMYVPVTGIEAGKKVSFYMGLRGSNSNSIKEMLFEFCFDGVNWVPAETGYSQTVLKSKASYHYAEYTLTSAVSKGVIAVRAKGGDSVQADGKAEDNRVMRVLFYNANGIDYKTTYGGPLVKID